MLLESEGMQFISISRRLTEKFEDDEFAKYIEAEREQVRVLYREGIVRALWTRKDVAGAVMLLECDDATIAAEAVGSLPLAQRGMLEVQILPLGPYPAFFPLH
jgi:muconolactone delta-isomerase